MADLSILQPLTFSHAFDPLCAVFEQAAHFHAVSDGNILVQCTEVLKKSQPSIMQI
jgi:hypothetical protein